MELRHLKYFLATARELHFARAAEKLNVTQPALSRQIAALEEELGVELFSRSNKWKIELTDAGQIFAIEAEKTLRSAERAVNLAQSAKQGGCGKLAIGAISSAIETPDFSHSLREMRARFPDLVIEIVDAISAGLPDRVRQHSLDIAFLRYMPNISYDDTLVCEHLWNDKLVIALPAEHQLATAEDFPPSALKDESFIMVPERTSSSLRHYLDNFFREHGNFVPRVNMEIYNTYTALRMVAGNLGVAVVSESYLGVFGDRISYRSFTGKIPEIPLYVIRAADNASKNAELFLSILKKRQRFKKTAAVL
ncbi:MAG: LysR family transcriptional regulator [Lentisphaeria bacterium]|nr:LysR family transcriptional regulator [Lentisphaeria bacterium]